MSGGSYNYAYSRVGDTINPLRADEVRQMAEDMRHHGPDCWGVANRMLVAAELMEAATVILRTVIGPMKALEWARSGDWMPEDVGKACRELAPPRSSGSAAGGTE